MAKKIHIYNITVSTGEEFKNVRIKGSISSRYSAIAPEYIPVNSDDGKSVEIAKYQIVKAELVSIED